MYRTYTLSTGEKVRVWVSSCDVISILDEERKDKLVVADSDMCIVNGNKYFIYNNEKIAVDGYDYMTVSELIASAKSKHLKAISNTDEYVRAFDRFTRGAPGYSTAGHLRRLLGDNSRADEQLFEQFGWQGYIDNDSVLCTLLRDTANFGFILSEEVFDVILPGLGIGLKGSGGVVTTVFAPCEGRYKRDNWHYKISYTAVDKSIRPMVGECSNSFMDWVSMFKCGMSILIDMSSDLESDWVKNIIRLDT